MLYFVFAAILVVALVISVLVGIFGTNSIEDRRGNRSNGPGFYGKVTAGVVLALFVVWTLASAFHTTPSRSVDIITSFGKYQTTKQSGPSWTAPWANSETFSTQVQTLWLDSGKDDGHKANISQNFADGGDGTVAVTVNWQIGDTEAEKLWQRFKTFENVRDNLVDARTRSVVKAVAGSRTSTEVIKGSELAKMNAEAKAQLQPLVSEYGIEIIDVTVTNVAVSDKTQQNIQAVIAANQGVEKAKADKQRAEIEAQTNKLRQNGGLLTPEANQRYCLDVMNNWDQNKNGPLPAGFNCTGGSGVVVSNK